MATKQQRKVDALLKTALGDTQNPVQLKALFDRVRGDRLFNELVGSDRL